jgi:hypothetical protein
MMGRRYQNYFKQIEFACFRELNFSRNNLNKQFIKIGKFQFLIKTENILATTVVFWFFLITFGKIIWKNLFVEASQRHGAKQESFSSVLYRKKNEKYCIWTTKTSEYNFFVLDTLINRFLYHWNIQPNREKKYIGFDEKKKIISITVSNVKVDDIKQPFLSQIQNTYLNSFTNIYGFFIKPFYKHFSYFFLFFFKI